MFFLMSFYKVRNDLKVITNYLNKKDCSFEQSLIYLGKKPITYLSSKQSKLIIAKQ